MVTWGMLTKNEQDELIKNIHVDYSNNEPIPKIATKYNLSRNCVHKILKNEIIQKANKENRRPSPKIYSEEGTGIPIHRTSLSNSEILNMLNDYDNGLHISDICIKYNVDSKLVSDNLKKYGIEIRHNKRLPQDIVNIIIQEYSEGKSTIKISQDLDVHIITVSRILKNHGIEIRGKQSVLNENQTMDVIKRYMKGESAKSISTEYHIHSNTVYRILQKNGIETRKNK